MLPFLKLLLLVFSAWYLTANQLSAQDDTSNLSDLTVAPEDAANLSSTIESLPEPPLLNVLLRTDFRNEVPSIIKPIKKGFMYNTGRLTFIPEGGFAIDVHSGPKLTLELDISWTDNEPDSSVSFVMFPTNAADFLTFSALAASDPVGISIHRSRMKDGDFSLMTSIFRTDGNGHGMHPIASQDQPVVAPKDAELTIEFNYGVVKVFQNATLLLQAYVQFNPTDMHRVTFETGSETHLLIEAVSVKKTPPVKVLGWTDKLKLLGAGKDDLVRFHLHEHGKYQEASELAEKIYRVCCDILGEFSPYTQQARDNLSTDLTEAGNYPRAIELRELSVQSMRRLLGDQHPKYAKALHSLGNLYKRTGDTKGALILCGQSLEIQKNALGERHAHYASTLDDLASLYRSIGDYARAEQLNLEAIEVFRITLGEQSQGYASSLSNLARHYHRTGDYVQAESMFARALEAKKATFGVQHPDYAATLHNIGQFYQTIGRYVQARELFERVLEIKKVTLGEQHPSYATTLCVLGWLQLSMGDYDNANSSFRKSAEITLDHLELTSAVQSQRQQVAMGLSLRYHLDLCLALATQEPKFQLESYEMLLRWKGNVWQRHARQRSLVDQPELQPQFQSLQVVSAKLSTLALRSPNDPNQFDSWRNQLGKLTEEREKLERDLSLASVAFREASMPVTPEQISESLPQQSILLDFFEYLHSTPENVEQKTRGSSERRLLVFVVRNDEPVQLIDLGDVASLNALVEIWRRDLGQSAASIEAAQKLRARIWEPLEMHLANITTVFASPDGLIGQFPLAALPGKRQGSYLIEDVAIVMLPVPQGLPAMALRPPVSAADEFCLIGGVDYEHASEAVSPSSRTGSTLLANRGSALEAFGPLPGTLSEINRIESVLRVHRPTTRPMILSGVFATESMFAKEATKSRFLHVATHGFFAPATILNTLPVPELGETMSVGEMYNPMLALEHPDLLSGLVFAGANDKTNSQSENDGILTAAEVQTLDLRNVDLAVLSACETGLGRISAGEGIIGLQRAFQLAGAHTTVTSLWKVDDAATEALMVEFYRNLFERKLSKIESLRKAQLWLLNNPNAVQGRNLTTRGQVLKIDITSDTKTVLDRSPRSLPAFWAAFQLSGDPR